MGLSMFLKPAVLLDKQVVTVAGSIFSSVCCAYTIQAPFSGDKGQTNTYY